MISTAAFDELAPAELYALLRLRVDVFVVEQECPYPELDGRDTEPGTLHLWSTDAATGAVESCLRLLTEADGSARIGRVATAQHARGRGLARALLAAALEQTSAGTVRLDAQTTAAGLYTGLGFAVDGPEFLDDGIPHVPMVLHRSTAPASAG
ncbi:GNAT family N-acetyltransferase [Nocardiopsis coralliicola]